MSPGETEQPVAAWKCEECRRWRAPDMAANALLVKEPGPEITTISGTETLYINRKIVVCDECRAKITGQPWGGW